MVIVAAILGGVTVLTELTLWAALLHLGIAELVVACMAIALVHGWNGASKRTPGQTGAHSEGWYDLLLAFIVFSTFALILSGSYMVRLGYGFSCATWPLCRGSVFPEEAAFLLHMAHRYVALFVGIFIVGASLKAWVQSRQNLKLFWVFSLAFGIFAVQVLIGAGMLWWGYSSLRALHLLMATLLWLSVVIVVLLHFRGKYTWVLKSSLGLDREPGTERVGP
jgi:heme A synthase